MARLEVRFGVLAHKFEVLQKLEPSLEPLLLLEVANLGDRVCLPLSSPRIVLRKGAVSSEGRGVHTRLLGFDGTFLRKMG